MVDKIKHRDNFNLPYISHDGSCTGMIRAFVYTLYLAVIFLYYVAVCCKMKYPPWRSHFCMVFIFYLRKCSQKSWGGGILRTSFIFFVFGFSAFLPLLQTFRSWQMYRYKHRNQCVLREWVVSPDLMRSYFVQKSLRVVHSITFTVWSCGLGCGTVR